MIFGFTANRALKSLIIVSAVALALAWTAPAMAGKKKPEEKAAAKIWAGIKANLDAGRELEACRLVKKLAPYENTETYHEAKKALLRKGISIQTPLVSYTSKAIVKAQNMVERNLVSTGDLKNIGVLPQHKDAWGTPLRVELATLKDYLYIVRSAGQDRKYMTEDDILIGGLKPKGFRDEPEGRKKTDRDQPDPNKKNKSEATRKGLLVQPGARTQEGGGGQSRSSSPQTETGDETQHQEESVELGDLLEKVQ